MPRSLVEANTAIGRVRAMPYGQARTEAAERELRRIEREGPDTARAYALTALVEALVWGGARERSFRPFARLLAWWDKHSELFDHYDQSVMFWEFGWIMSDLTQLPEAPREQIETALDDMEQRFAIANRGLERVWTARLDWALLRGAEDIAQTVTRWLTLPLDDEDSCPACHEALRAEYLLWSGDRPAAVAVLEAAIASNVTCSREPASMLTDLALAYLDEGRLGLVEETVPRALAELAKAASIRLSTPYARVFEVYGRGGRPDLAFALLAERFKELSADIPYSRLVVLRHITAGTAGLLAAGYADEPVAAPGVEAATARELHAWASAEAAALTARFDARNGTSEQTRRLDAARAAVPAARRLEFALPPTPAKDEQRLVLGRAAKRLEAALPTPGEAAAAEQLSADESGAVLSEPPAAQAAREAAPDSSAGPDRAVAEAAWAAGSFAAAAAAYERSAQAAQAAGLLRESGWDWAEAARCRQELGDLAAAAAAYTAALFRLQAAGAPVEELARLLVAWAPALRAEDLDGFLTAAAKAEEALPSLANGQSGDASLSDMAVFSLTYRPLRRQLRARADIADSVARVLATWGGPERTEEAAAKAQTAAVVYTSIGAMVDAAHARWLAGRLTLARDLPEAALADLRQAARWFEEAGPREKSSYAAVRAELAVLLRRLGQDDEADKLSPDADKPSQDLED
ncbi:MAG: hypothetical protein LBI84_10640 [Propionibacteriaceae bacterium]|jgi:hypothetical protein|nr:hypothetical protein [Propionibacteriaceae bacterium]